MEMDFHTLIHYSQSSYLGRIDSTAGFPIGPIAVIDQVYSGNKYGIDLDVRKDFSAETSLLTGISYESQQCDPYHWMDTNTNAPHGLTAFNDKHDTYDTSLFAQLDIVPLNSLRVVGGFRYNNNKDYGDTAVPRVSAVLKASDSLFFKLLYGSAYRNPTFFEKYVDTAGVLIGSPNLKPEKIDTYELAGDYAFSKNVVRLALFYNSTDQKIDRSKTGVPTYINTTGQNIQGGEVEFQGNPIKNLLSYRVNMSYKDGKEKSDDSTIQYLDKVTANAVLTHVIGGFTNELTVNYIGERQGNILGGTVFPLGTAITVPAYTLVNVQVSYAITKQLKASLIAMNVFGTTVLYPEYIRQRIDTIPGESNASIFGKVSYKF
jgi:outer membrane receptor protein involved in Fe transport